MLTVYLALVVFVVFPYLLVLLRNLIWDLYLWQVKEYRFDRIWSHWFVEKGKGVRSEILTLVKIALGTTAVYYFFSPSANILVIALILSFTISWAEGLVFIQKFSKGKFLRPQIKSLRNSLILILNILFAIVPFIFLYKWLSELNISTTTPVNISIADNLALGNFLPRFLEGRVIFPVEFSIVLFVTIIGLGLELLSPVVIAFGVGLTTPLAYIKRQVIIFNAKKKIKAQHKIKVVAVTGSYGKSTSKELIYQLLSKKFRTIKTNKNNNTDIGIAQTIMRDLNKDTEVFVVEMGAYKIGEINDCCEIAVPDVAIVTGVDQQHVTLFGGIPEILKSTYEVIEKLKPDGLVILNGDNEYCIKLAEKTRKRKKLYFSIRNSEKLEVAELDSKQEIRHKVTFPGNENIFVSEIFETQRGLSFNLNFDKESYVIHSNLKVIYNISNLLAAILVAFELGMTMKDVVKAINSEDFKVPYLNIYNGINDSKILDDGYNINPTGFMAAINYLDGLKIRNKKWLMTQGMIELGDERAQIYSKIAQMIVKKVDYLYTSDKLLVEEVKSLEPDFRAVLVNSVFDFPIYYEHLVKKNQMVLLEGPFPQIVLNKIYKETRL